MKRTKSKPTRRSTRNQFLKKKYAEPQKLPFIAHVYELRKRLFYITVAIGIFGGLATSIQSQLTDLLLKPAGKQQFIYTSPGGGFDFAFRLCLYTGIFFSIPVIVYQLLRYLQPLIKKHNAQFMAWTSFWSGILALIGITFGYYVGLPAGLHFLLQGFSTDQIKALISIQAYLQFVMVYLLGSALLFQIPLVLILINRFKRLKPRKLFSYQRWVVIASFILGAIISPSPDIRNQAILSGPIILMYELSIVLIWCINRKYHKPRKVVALLQKDAEARAERLAKFESAQQAWRDALSAARSESVATPTPKPTQAAVPVSAPAPVSRPQTLARPNKYIGEFRQRQQYRAP